MIKQFSKHTFSLFLILLFMQLNSQDSLTKFRLTKHGKEVPVNKSDHIHIINSIIFL